MAISLDARRKWQTIVIITKAGMFGFIKQPHWISPTTLFEEIVGSTW